MSIHRPKPFLAKGRRTRKRQVFALRQRLMASKEPTTWLFATPAALDAETCVADLVFFSPRDKAVFYHAQVRTAAAACLDAVDALAEARCYGAVAAADISPLRHAAAAQERQAILARREVAVFAQARVDRRMPHAVVIEAVLDAPALTAPVLTAFVEAFWAGGERSWRSSEALYFDARVLDETQLPPEPERVPAGKI